MCDRLKKLWNGFGGFGEDRGKGVRVFSVSVSVLGAEECVEW